MRSPFETFDDEECKILTEKGSEFQTGSARGTGGTSSGTNRRRACSKTGAEGEQAELT